MNSKQRAKRQKSRIKIDGKSKVPKVAAIASARATDRIRDGINALRAIKTSREATAAVANGYPCSVDAFRKWKGIGSDTLYKTNRRYLESIQIETARIRNLHDQALQSVNKTDRPASKEYQIAELKSRIKYLEDINSLIAGEVLSAGKSWENERRHRLYIEAHYKEVTGQEPPGPTVIETQPSDQDARPIEVKIADIEAHRLKRQNAELQDRSV
ncbi:hypothetical protein AA309_23255 [Microvirga vignae]|uniref:Uncharacterized protein n=1 Tax=Microvirga vignae TaxID=1225564 RepID=A0A0H1R6U3_9HYPH|nr:hypothetical protein [Microvirga vignae]KLK90843.1 hypothetical protein AA309_23255 [Microvirga vignae]